MSVSSFEEERRFRCECFSHLDYTNGNPARMLELKKRLREKRGAQAAEKVIEGMNAFRREWLDARKRQIR